MFHSFDEVAPTKLHAGSVPTTVSDNLSISRSCKHAITDSAWPAWAHWDKERPAQDNMCQLDDHRISGELGHT